MECGAAVHLEGFALVVGEYEHGMVVGRVLAPPASPRILAPRPGPPPNMLRPMIVAPMFARRSVDDGGARVGLTALLAVHLAERLEREKPFVERHSAYAKRVLFALGGTGDVAVE